MRRHDAGEGAADTRQVFVLSRVLGGRMGGSAAKAISVIDSVSEGLDCSKESWLWIFADPDWQAVLGGTSSTLVADFILK